MRRYRISVPILMALLIVFGLVEFGKVADATIRSSIEDPVYTIADKDFSAALSKGKHVIKLGPMFWGLYPGAIVFKTPEDALEYMQEKEMNTEGFSVYRLSGNYESDVNQGGSVHRINKSLMIVEKVKCESA
jgi:hypothetical protein